MTLVPGASLLLDARKRKYAIPQFNVLNLEMIDAVLSTAEELKAPVVVGIVDRHFPVLDVESLVSAIKKKAQTMEASVILHLDHGRTYERAMEAIRMGFTSVMYDGSLLPIEENIQITNAIIKTAHAVGVSVEAELGHVGSQNAGDENKVTSVSDAVEFVQRTNV
ncbi:class II fructose-bisphosphate aldolase, partial [Domibacillus robiginosus]|uniref:class II fructose-bisphosphate aldolase n=1 Tax=Domibacillus robiginosus TaxID=1071054 RepID=UPI00155A0EED